MQIVQTLNDFIKILYTPSMENICLGDFILVQEIKRRFLGQVVEITDDKFDDSKNIAQIKLTHAINEKGEIVDFDFHLPSKQCDILYANRREIIDFINEGKKVVSLGEDYKFSKPFEINIDFFKNNALIFCDKIKEYNSISSKLAKRLSKIKNTIVFDYTGALEIERAQKFSALIDFKLPLDYYSLDYIWEKGFSRASLETQAICEEIFNEVKNYSLVTKNKFIPYKQFIKVVNAQYGATPIRELLVLKNRLQKYQQEGIFANTKVEFSGIFKNLNKEKITIIDLSKLKSFWHKDFTEFVLRNIGINSFVFVRLNETNFDNNLLDLLYNTNKKITPMPSISHGFAKLPAISEYCRNYIILPSLSVKKDFGYINNTITSMSKNSVLLYGQDCKNFALVIKNLDVKEIENKAPVKKVTFEGDIIKNMRVKDKLTQLNQKKMREIEQDVDKFLSSSIKLAPIEPKKDNIEAQEFVPNIAATPIEDASFDKEQSHKIEDIISEEELDLIDSLELDNKDEAPTQEVVADDVLDTNENIVANNDEEISDKEIVSDKNVIDEDIFIANKEITTDENYEKDDTDNDFAIDEIEQETDVQQENVIEQAFDDENIVSDDIISEDITDSADVVSEVPIQSEPLDIKETEEKNEDGSQEELLETIEDFSLEDLAAESIETTFEQMVEEKEDEPEQTNNETLIETLVDMPPKEEEDEQLNFSKEFIEDIPIFTPDRVEANKDEKYKEGDNVSHEKYGNGKVLQVVEYADKVLLQIEFKQIGKRLLDPIAANLRKI